jgi:hypothetical protein
MNNSASFMRLTKNGANLIEEDFVIFEAVDSARNVDTKHVLPYFL